MKTITITNAMITSATAIALSAKLDITTINAKGVERTGSEQAKQLKRMLAKDGLSYVEETKAKVESKERAVQMDTRKGKVTKSSKVRAMILEHDATLGKSALIKKFQAELDFSYSLAYTYYAKNRAILVKTGKIAPLVKAKA